MSDRDEYRDEERKLRREYRLSHEEQEHAYNRIKSQAMSMLVRCRRMRDTIEKNTGLQLELPI